MTNEEILTQALKCCLRDMYYRDAERMQLASWPQDILTQVKHIAMTYKDCSLEEGIRQAIPLLS